MFIIAGTQGNDEIIRTEENKTLCKHCNNKVNKKVICHNDKFTLFFMPVLPYNKRYYRVCPICNITQEITESEARFGMQSEESVGYTGYRDESAYINIPGYQDNSKDLK